jgi:hypothetical protein
MASDEQRQARLMYAIDRVSKDNGQDNSNLFTPEFLEEYCLPLSNMEIEKTATACTLYCMVDDKRIERVLKYPFKSKKLLTAIESLDSEFVDLCRSGS